MNIRLANSNDIEKINELFQAVINDLNNVKKLICYGEIYILFANLKVIF